MRLGVSEPKVSYSWATILSITSQIISSFYLFSEIRGCRVHQRVCLEYHRLVNCPDQVQPAEVASSKRLKRAASPMEENGGTLVKGFQFIIFKLPRHKPRTNLNKQTGDKWKSRMIPTPSSCRDLLVLVIFRLFPSSSSYYINESRRCRGRRTLGFDLCSIIVPKWEQLGTGSNGFALCCDAT